MSVRVSEHMCVSAVFCFQSEHFRNICAFREIFVLESVCHAYVQVLLVLQCSVFCGSHFVAAE